MIVRQKGFWENDDLQHGLAEVYYSRRWAELKSTLDEAVKVYSFYSG